MNSDEGATPLSRDQQFEDDLTSSRRFEASLVWRELLALAAVVAMVVVRELWFS